MTTSPIESDESARPDNVRISREIPNPTVTDFASKDLRPLQKLLLETFLEKGVSGWEELPDGILLGGDSLKVEGDNLAPSLTINLDDIKDNPLAQSYTHEEIVQALERLSGALIYVLHYNGEPEEHTYLKQIENGDFHQIVTVRDGDSLKLCLPFAGDIDCLKDKLRDPKTFSRIVNAIDLNKVSETIARVEGCGIC